MISVGATVLFIYIVYDIFANPNAIGQNEGNEIAENDSIENKELN
jgi:hypothetical protein